MTDPQAHWADEYPRGIYEPVTPLPRSTTLHELLLCAARGSAEAFGRFNSLTSDLITNYLLLRTDDVDATEKLTRMTYMLALSSVGDYREQGISAEAWILRFARSWADEKLADPFGLAITAYGTEVDQLVQAMKQLDSTTQECLALSCFLRLDGSIIAEVMRLSEQDVHRLTIKGVRSIAILTERLPQ